MSFSASEIRHGRTGYDKHRCRCVVCRAANTAHVAKVRAARLLRLKANPVPESDPAHGTYAGVDAGCRCEACRLHRQSRYWRTEGQRPHRWRERVTETYRAARAAWEALRESSAPAWSVAGAAGSNAGCYQLSDAEFACLHPPPRFADFLRGMRLHSSDA